MSQPFFTIGVTTYDRHELLKQALASILAQSFGDFEVIVGNDYTDDVLTADVLGVHDIRVRIVNHPQNLQELGNMNALLAMASGRYFTWLADDDLYEPDFLRTAHDVLTRSGLPPGFFSSYRVYESMAAPPPAPVAAGEVRTLDGREFLDSYFAGELKIISVYGVFDTAKLRTLVRGVEELSASAGRLHAEYFFLVKCALLGRIAYNNAPLVLFRTHAGSWGGTHLEFDRYREAGSQLTRRCGQLLMDPALFGDLSRLVAICDIHLLEYASKLAIEHASTGKLCVRAMCRSVQRLSMETSNMHRSFVEAGAADDARAFLAFAWIRIKYSLLMVRIITVKWLRNSRSHDRV